MAEYIDRDALMTALHSGNIDLGFVYKETYRKLREYSQKVDKVIKSVPAADVAPVRRGKWIQHYEPYDTGEEWAEAPYGFECSECGRCEAEKEPFCNCGAKIEVNDERQTMAVQSEEH